jgi:translation elongation factor EF-1alpha
MKDTGKVTESQMKYIDEFSLKYDILTHHEDARLAYVADKCNDERYRRVTFRTRAFEWQTGRHTVTLLDTPGFYPYIKSAIKGMSMSDYAALVVCVQGYERSWSKAMLAYGMGIRRMAVLVNKVDLIGYCEKRFMEVKVACVAKLIEIGFKEQDLNFIPISVLENQNILKTSDKMKWYKGLTFLDYIDSLECPLKRLDAPFRFQILKVERISGAGLVISGRVMSGTITEGQTITCMPGNFITQIKSLQSWHTPISYASAGDFIGLKSSHHTRYSLNRCTYIHAHAHAHTDTTLARSMLCVIHTLQSDIVLKVGVTGVVYVSRSRSPATVLDILHRLDKANDDIVEYRPDSIQLDCRYVVVLHLHNSLQACSRDAYGKMSSIVYMHSGEHVASGYAIEVYDKDGKSIE